MEDLEKSKALLADWLRDIQLSIVVETNPTRKKEFEAAAEAVKRLLLHLQVLSL